MARRPLLCRLAAFSALLVLLGLPELPAQTLPSFLPFTVHSGQPQRGAATSGPDYRGFRSVDTEHFRFIYEPRDEQAVTELISYADRVYEQMADFLGTRPSRIRVLVNGRTDLANGFFDPLPPHHMAVFVAAPTAPRFGARTESWLRLVFVHELAHYMHFVYDHGLFSGIPTVFAAEAASLHGVFMAGWMIEGLAIYAESAFTEGGRLSSPHFELYLKAPIVEDRTFDLRRAAYDTHLPPPGRFYVAGAAIVEYIADEYGPGTLREIHREYVRLPFLGMNHAVKRAVGREMHDLYDAMLDRRAQRYGQRSDVPEGARITSQGVSNFRGVRVRNGALYAHRSAPDERPGIVRLPPVSAPGQTEMPTDKPTSQHPEAFAEAEQLIVASLADPDSFDVSRDGSRIVYAAQVSKPSQPAGGERVFRLYERNLTSGDDRRVTDATGLFHPVYVPGTRFAVAVQRRGTYHRLVAVDLESGDLSVLHNPQAAYIYHPDISPSAREVSFARNERGIQRVYRLPLAVTEEDGLRPSGEAIPATAVLSAGSRGNAITPQHHPRYGSDGLLYYVAERDGELVLHRVTGSGAVERVLRDRIGIVSGAMYEDHIYYVTYRSDGYEIRRKTPEFAEIAPLERLLAGAGQAADDGAAALASPPPPMPRADLKDAGAYSARRHYGFPWPRAWLPYPSVTTRADGNLDLGMGLFLHGVGLPRRTAWYLAMGYHPTVNQPHGFFALSSRYGRALLSYELDQRYQSSWPGRARQTTSQIMEARVDLYRRFDRDTTTRITLSGAIEHLMHASADSDFPFMLPNEHYALAGAGVSAGKSSIGSARDLYPQRFLQGGFSIAHPIPGIGAAHPGLRTRADLIGSFPLGGGFSGSVSASGRHTTGAVPQQRPIALRGFEQMTAISRDLPALLSGRLELRSPGKLTDVPLPLLLSLQGFGGALFVEAQAAAGLSAGDGPHPALTFEPDSAVHVGGEIALKLGVSIGDVIVRPGIALRLDWEERRAQPQLYVRL